MEKRNPASDSLIGYTTLAKLDLEFDRIRSVCDLTLQLENPANQNILILVLKEVSNLRLMEFGGGLTQLLCLRINNVTEVQLDRINFQIIEIERRTFECYCRYFEMEQASDIDAKQ